MGTFLFDKIIFGPVNSRRLGVSLGVNLLPTDIKICTFNCIYCECGFNSTGSSIQPKLPSHEEVYESLKAKLKLMKSQDHLPDVITFAGNGEPTIHPKFDIIINDTIALRDEFCPNAKIAVLSNATMLHKQKVIDALIKVDDNILKLDGGLIDNIRLLDQPKESYSLEKITEQLKAFKGQLIIQTMFVKGEYKGKNIDNTTEDNVNAWVKLIADIKPQSVMLYSIDRDTPAKDLIKVTKEEMENIAIKIKALGIKTQISG